MNKKFDVSKNVIQTERLTLRAWKEADLDDFFEYARVDGVGQMAGWSPHRSIEESSIILEHFISRKHTFALEYDSKVIGSLGLEAYKEENYPELDSLCGCEIGYVLSKDYWGRGLMTEAVKAVIDHLFFTEKLDFILVGHFDHNKRSARVIEKCGFKYVKTVPYETRFNTIETALEYILYHPERREYEKLY